MSETNIAANEAPARAWDVGHERWVYLSDLQDAVAQAISAAKLLFGEPEYTYHKKEVRWSTRDKSHFVGIDSGPTITREEYEANATQSEINETERFMGRLKRSYWRYERKQVAPAWREELLKLIPKYPE